MVVHELQYMYVYSQLYICFDSRVIENFINTSGFLVTKNYSTTL